MTNYQQASRAQAAASSKICSPLKLPFRNKAPAIATMR